MFFINTVNGHLWHLIPGAHFVRPHTIEPNPRVYEPIDQHADHYHWDNAQGAGHDPVDHGREDDRRGGGHAHSGLMIYLGDNWPEEYRGKLFTLNFHGRRINVERLERAGSGYVGRHEPDIVFAADPWFRGIDLSYGPDGGVFVLDWSDTGECHEHNGVHRTSGRIYKFTYGQPARASPSATSTKLDDRATSWTCTATRTSGSSARPGASSPTGRPRGELDGRGRHAARRDRSPRDPIRSSSSGRSGRCTCIGGPTTRSLRALLARPARSDPRLGHPAC